MSLIAPITAQASDVVNLEEINSYSRSTKRKPSRIDSKTFINQVNEDIANLDGDINSLGFVQNEFEAGSFSETTTLDSSVVLSLIHI